MLSMESFLKTMPGEINASVSIVLFFNSAILSDFFNRGNPLYINTKPDKNQIKNKKKKKVPK